MQGNAPDEEHLDQHGECRHEIKMLGAALLWARNYIDVGKPELKSRVVVVLDDILKEREPTIADMAEFRSKYLRRVVGQHESS